MASDDIWLSPFRASYRYIRVSRATGLEVGAIESFTGGSISRNQDTDTYESASLDYVGRLDVGNDFVRIYLDAEDPLSGASRTVCLGTFECSTPSRSVSGEVATGTATLYGRLHDLAKDDFDEPYAIPAGSNAVAAAREIVEGCGLEVIAEPSDYTLSASWVFGIAITPDNPDSKLGAVNRLLAAAGFRGATTDAYGRVLFRRYREPAARPIDHAFSEGEDCRVLPDITDEQDDFDAVNVVHVDFTVQGESVRGTASDDSPESEWSTVSTGRRIVKRYQYSDLPAGESVVAGGSYPLIGAGTHDSATFRASGSAGTVSAVGVSGCPIGGISQAIRITKGSASGEIGLAQDKISLKKGQPYTETVYLYASARTQVKIMPIWRPDDGGETRTLDIEQGWTRLTLTATPTKSEEYSVGYIYLSYGAPTGSYIDVAQIKVEEGAVATPLAIEAANEKAASLLATECSVIRRLTITAIFTPDADVYSACSIRLPSAGAEIMRACVRRMDLELTMGCPMRLELRNYLRGDAS